MTKTMATARAIEMHIQMKCIPYRWLKSNSIESSAWTEENMLSQPKTTSIR